MSLSVGERKREGKNEKVGVHRRVALTCCPHSDELWGCLRAALFRQMGRASHGLSFFSCTGVPAPAGGVAAEEVPDSARCGSTCPRKAQVRVDAFRSCACLAACLLTWCRLPLLLTILSPCRCHCRCFGRFLTLKAADDILSKMVGRALANAQLFFPNTKVSFHKPHKSTVCRCASRGWGAHSLFCGSSLVVYVLRSFA